MSIEAYVGDDYRLSFKDRERALAFAQAVEWLTAAHGERDAYEFTQRIAWKYMDAPVKYSGRDLPDHLQVPAGLWVWLRGSYLYEYEAKDPETEQIVTGLLWATDEYAVEEWVNDGCLALVSARRALEWAEAA